MPSRNRKKTDTGNSTFRLALISMPWQLHNRPSIQLGCLKSFLGKKAPWVVADLFHPYLEVARRLDTGLYYRLSKDMWACESLYGALLYPGKKTGLKKTVGKSLRKAGKEIQKKIGFEEILAVLQEQLDTFAAQEWGRYQLVGFSVCCNQLLASLAAAALMKKRFPKLPIVFGGSSCAGELGAALLQSFDIDYVVNGEGELPLLSLCESLAEDREARPGMGIRTRTAGTGKTVSGAAEDTDIHQLADLQELPAPDYADYFRDLGHWFRDAPLIPELPVEFSRGCWWGKCTFCNLNLQWQGYRAKNTEQLIDEITMLADRHGCLDFLFTDNALPPKKAAALFRRTAQLNRDYRFFGEIRFSGRPEILADFGRGGLSTVQAGIESLSNSLLKKMNKGVSVMDNVALMKEAVQQSITLEGNLIIEFPGSTGEEVRETLENLDFVLPFHPLSAAAFFLGYASPVYCNPEEHGIKAVIPHPGFARIFPRKLLHALPLLVRGYRADRGAQRKLWKPVARKMKAWQEFHRQRAHGARNRPALSYRDGDTFLIIRQEQPGRPTLHHRLRGASRQIYLFCAEVRREEEIFQEFKKIKSSAILPFLQQMAEKRLLFIDNDRYLALAVRERIMKKQQQVKQHDQRQFRSAL